jgi:hypothetical protein
MGQSMLLELSRVVEFENGTVPIRFADSEEYVEGLNGREVEDEGKGIG